MSHTLVIKGLGGQNLGLCYNAMYYEISCCYKLSPQKIKELFNMGVIGYGQEFHIHSKCDGTEEPVKNESGEYFYVYKTEARVDSSD